MSWRAGLSSRLLDHRVSRTTLVHVLLSFVLVAMLAYSYAVGLDIGMHQMLPGPLYRHLSALAIAISEHAYGLDAGKAAFLEVYEALGRHGFNHLDWKDSLEEGLYHSPAAINAAIRDAANLDILDPGRLHFLWGNAKGLADFFELSFSLFGYNVQGFYHTYFVLMALITLAFVATFRDRPEYLVLPAAYLLVHLGLMEVLPRLNWQYATVFNSRQMPAPAFYAALYFLTAALAGPRRSLWLLTVMVMVGWILMLLVEVRTVGMWMPVALASLGIAIVIARHCAWLSCRLVRYRWFQQLRPYPLLVATVVGLFLHVSYMQQLNPEYRSRDGASGHVFWHSMLVSLCDVYRGRIETYGCGDPFPGGLVRERIEQRGETLSDYTDSVGSWIWVKYEVRAKEAFFSLYADFPLITTAAYLESIFVMYPLITWRIVNVGVSDDWLLVALVGLGLLAVLLLPSVRLAAMTGGILAMALGTLPFAALTLVANPQMSNARGGIISLAAVLALCLPWSLAGWAITKAVARYRSRLLGEWSADARAGRERGPL